MFKKEQKSENVLITEPWCVWNVSLHVCFSASTSDWYFCPLCAAVHAHIFCLIANISIFPCLCVSVYLSSVWTICLCLCVLPSVRRCSVPQAVTSSRPSDYCCLLHWQINPVNNYNPSPSLSLPPPRPRLLFNPSLSFILTHSLIFNVVTYSAFL